MVLRFSGLKENSVRVVGFLWGVKRNIFGRDTAVGVFLRRFNIFTGILRFGRLFQGIRGRGGGRM